MKVERGALVVGQERAVPLEERDIAFPSRKAVKGHALTGYADRLSVVSGPARPPGALRGDEEGRARLNVAVGPTVEAHESKTDLGEPFVGALGRWRIDLGDLPEAALVVDLDLVGAAATADDAEPGPGAGCDPVAIGQLEDRPAAWSQVARRRFTTAGQLADARWCDDELEAPAGKLKVDEAGLDQLRTRQAPSSLVEHRGMGIDADYRHARPRQRCRKAARANPEVKHGALRGFGQAQPGLRAFRLGQRCVELREAGVRVVGVVADDARHAGRLILQQTW